MGNATLATIEESEMIRVNATEPHHKVITARNAHGTIAARIPALVAIPLPPLNPSHGV